MRIRITSLILVLVFICCGLTVATAESNSVYQLGDKMDDFTVTLSDGTTVSLYGMLAEKKVVMLNIWASWCNPCRLEFPFMQEAYTQLSNDVGIVALSIHDPDTDEVINDYKAEVGLTTLPLGRDIGLVKRFHIEGYPTSVIIDRNGVICLIHAGAILSTNQFTYLFEQFTSDDYSEPVLLTKMPVPALHEAPGAQALSQALNAPGSGIKFFSMTSGDKQPFAPSEDGSFARSTNGDKVLATSNVTAQFTASAGDVFVYEYQIDGRNYLERLAVYLDEDVVDLHTGESDWTQAGVAIKTEGEQKVDFVFTRGPESDFVPEARLRNARLLTGAEAKAFEFPAPPPSGTLPEKKCDIQILSPAKEIVYLTKDGTIDTDNPPMFILDTDAADIRLQYGQEIDPRFTVFSVAKGSNVSHAMLDSLENDGEGYITTVDLSDSTHGATLLLPDNILDIKSITERFLFRDEGEAKNYLTDLLPKVQAQYTPEVFDEQFGGWSLAYRDAGVICTFEEILNSPNEDESLPEEVEFVVNYTDTDGNPVAGVMTQICDDSICLVLMSDENGTVRHPSAPQPYEIHVLMVPAGYEPISEIYHMEAAGGVLDITLEKAG